MWARMCIHAHYFYEHCAIVHIAYPGHLPQWERMLELKTEAILAHV